MNDYYPFLIFIALVIGFIAGSYQMAQQWANNSKSPVRKYWNGELYKVMTAIEYGDLAEKPKGGVNYRGRDTSA